MSRRLSRRELCGGALAGGASVLIARAGLADVLRLRQPPAAVRREMARPQAPCGVAAGDVHEGTAVIWSRCDRPARMVVEYSTSDTFTDVRGVEGSIVTPETDFTGRVVLNDLGQGECFYRVRFVDPDDPRVASEPAVGRLRVPRREGENLRLAFAGDTCGQGYGINPEWGGLRIYETIRGKRPHAFIHSGDTIYADGPIPEKIELDDGSVWHNVTTEEKSKVAETLAEFRGNYKYNLFDDNLRRFQAEVPLVVQWDDHEVLNNWYPGEMLDDGRYAERRVDVLAARARRAFFEYQPIAFADLNAARIYRSFPFGPHVELFLLDMRSYRGVNSKNRQETLGSESALLGPEQLNWLKSSLAASKATWKIVCSDMPIGLIVGDSPVGFDNAANGPGPALGRELEIADLLAHLKRAGVANVVWVTADVHYAAAHHYDPTRAKFAEFDPFWEFVAGPLNAGTFGPGELDPTFGPEVKFSAIPPGMKGNRPPSEGRQFFGLLDVDAGSLALTVSLHNVAGEQLYSIDLPAKL